MVFTASSVVLAASSLLLWAPSPVAADIAYNTTTYVSCYSSIPNDFINNGSWIYQSKGYCQHQCVPLGYPVMAMTNGNECWCGHELPANSTQSQGCDKTCVGYSDDGCGGKSAFDVYLTGFPMDDSSSDTSSSTTSSATTSTTAGVTVVTQAGQTIFITASSEPSASSKSSGTNTAGIAAGVVVGVVVLSAIIGAAVFFLRRRQKQRVEEEYRRNAEINAFAQKPSSMSSDARWDSDFMAQRRQSNGSIADSQDFSRRILQVTNPDR
ncbi:WSC domain protein, putative [Talaromyces stipitatus ATCC 10500]|uniref:WSC domain protein, putative n=1 Tax=Talaromyces stipitatus (strain ATCC 10500 / CBS 375.48 / QM 6759 / NRRL 1006) TaxID=441959 RepID=B8M9C1_TALSN|nr:WSC domain protein, putative [Talaromyces stipitatus ATCC 10500]EED17681.1 WSC domain protein, putative [Talaromyces stipitatus ATCC 10500]